MGREGSDGATRKGGPSRGIPPQEKTPGKARKEANMASITTEAPVVEAPVADETEAPKAEVAKAPAKAKMTKAEKTAARQAKSLERFPVLNEKKAAWVAANARPAMAPCLCGCGTLTKGRFAPGHDATLKVTLSNTAKHGTPEAAKLAKAALKTFGW